MGGRIVAGGDSAQPHLLPIKQIVRLEFVRAAIMLECGLHLEAAQVGLREQRLRFGRLRQLRDQILQNGASRLLVIFDQLAEIVR